MIHDPFPDDRDCRPQDRLPREPGGDEAYTNPKTKVSSRLESTSIPGFKASGRFKQKLEAARAAAAADKAMEETA